MPYTVNRFFIYTPQAFRGPQGLTREAIEGHLPKADNASDDTFPGIGWFFSFDSHHVRCYIVLFGAGWSSQVARRAHNPKVVGSNPAPATNSFPNSHQGRSALFFILNASLDNKSNFTMSKSHAD
jgi:hypothetical protein